MHHGGPRQGRFKHRHTSRARAVRTHWLRESCCHCDAAHARRAGELDAAKLGDDASDVTARGAASYPARAQHTREHEQLRCFQLISRIRTHEPSGAPFPAIVLSRTGPEEASTAASEARSAGLQRRFVLLVISEDARAIANAISRSAHKRIPVMCADRSWVSRGGAADGSGLLGVASTCGGLIPCATAQRGRVIGECGRTRRGRDEVGSSKSADSVGKG